jgi:hypothetical protein
MIVIVFASGRVAVAWLLMAAVAARQWWRS